MNHLILDVDDVISVCDKTIPQHDDGSGNEFYYIPLGRMRIGADIQVLDCPMCRKVADKLAAGVTVPAAIRESRISQS